MKQSILLCLLLAGLASAALAQDTIKVVLCAPEDQSSPPAPRHAPRFSSEASFLLFDAGDGAERSMETLQLPINTLRAVFITHFHSDHIGDLAEAMDRSYVNARRQVLTVYGPTGLTEVLDGFVAAYKLEQSYRTAHHGQDMMPPQYWGAVPVEFPTPVSDNPVVIYNQNGVVVKAFLEQHPPVVPAVGYRVEYGGKVVVISGDTVLTDALLQQSMGADLLVSEAMNKALVQQQQQQLAAAGNTFGANIYRDIQEYHMDVSEVAQLAQQAQVKQLALTHITPPLSDPTQLANAFTLPVSQIYTGTLVVPAADGAQIVITVQ